MLHFELEFGRPREGEDLYITQGTFFAGETLVPHVLSERALSASVQLASVPHDTFLRG